MSTPPTGEDPTPPSSDDSPTLPPTMPRRPHGAGQPEEGRPQGAGPGSGPEDQPLVHQQAYASTRSTVATLYLQAIKAGMYIVRINTPTETQIRRLVLLD